MDAESITSNIKNITSIPASNKKTTASVEWIRFFAAVCVIMFHFEALYFGEHRFFEHMAVMVDFFFALSGYLLMKNLKKGDKIESSAKISPLMDSVTYVFKRVKRIYFPYIAAFFMVFILTTITQGGGSLSQILLRLFHFKWEALLLQMAGFNPSPAFDVDYLVGSAWYLSAMFIAMIPTYYLASRFRSAFSGVIAPLIALLTYCYIMQTYETLNVGNEMVGFVMLGTLRAFAGLSVGCFSFALFEKLNAKASRMSSVPSKIIEFICFLALPLLLVFNARLTESDVLFWLFIFAALIIFCFSDKTPIARFLNRNMTELGRYLGRLSLYIYLFHWFFVLLFTNYFQGLGYLTGQLTYICSVFLFSIIAMKVAGKINEKLKPSLSSR
jgi:peptidoglycan/LPS O-acetylase OafA/YrhL